MSEHIICPICTRVTIELDSESGIAGACALCRDTVIPKYISLVQHHIYVKLYLKEKM